jgi:outer membrane protein OmpA-like peptidoglycan-associated protein
MFLVAWGPGLEVLGTFWAPSQVDGPEDLTPDVVAVDGGREPIDDESIPVTKSERPIVGAAHNIVGAVLPVWGPALLPEATKVRPLTIRFGFNCDTIHPTAARKLQRWAARLPTGTLVRIGGHTDRIGGPGYNRRLSVRRAMNVAAAITASPTGTRALELRVRGYGETKPLPKSQHPDKASGRDIRRLNRRVEVQPEPPDEYTVGSDKPPIRAGPAGACTE